MSLWVGKNNSTTALVSRVLVCVCDACLLCLWLPVIHASIKGLVLACSCCHNTLKGTRLLANTVHRTCSIFSQKLQVKLLTSDSAQVICHDLKPNWFHIHNLQTIPTKTPNNIHNEIYRKATLFSCISRIVRSP